MRSDVICICKEPVSYFLHVLLSQLLVEHALSVVLLPSFSRIAGCLFTVRSQATLCSVRVRAAGSVKYIWPLQTAVSDFGAQRKRLDAIRSELGWPIIGCKYVECYS